ncbi:hypothetical protein BGI15_01185 [Snodgrassella alvi]|uniref:pilus assembly PilX family protein n=1 Tax=Snodgrassella alvi TaxID=1196083 RepID=UPI000A0406BE|nr:PilX N-terminal domain-containing pilus assembly protein [Snodgrassella alvi]ORF00016.1 hypothetical protein BGH97_09715 [Snodgrassella alvi]ORF06736.1 hypothetical protein BGH99_11275 [Snodgrassella alvi]ORF10108.1 hypothetical protein BGI00_11085 [Snodgrassella alvi]ORF11373.1 hypothetical protein BGI02_11040 [Snodgrassella alvi]ORF17598.1 hypothetical protein BGI05_11040 [Snodgrassella alvi]
MKINYKFLQSKQSGFALFLVLVMMIVIAFLVVATMLSTSMDTRTSANDSDYQLAFQNAQLGLKAAEERISDWPGLKTQQKFTCDCKDGLCAAKGINPLNANKPLAKIDKNCSNLNDLKDVWRRPEVLTNSDKDPSTKQAANLSEEIKYRYVIEYLGPDSNAGVGVYLFRITAKGWGRNASTSSMIEETIQAALYDI